MSMEEGRQRIAAEKEKRMKRRWPFCSCRSSGILALRTYKEYRESKEREGAFEKNG